MPTTSSGVASRVAPRASTAFAIAALLATAALPPAKALEGPPAEIGDKTLVAWVRIADLDQKGGSVLTLENPGGEFDAIVFGELAPRRWMAGSDSHRRTGRDQAAWPEESAPPDRLVQIAIAWHGRHATIWRDGKRYAEHELASGPARFSTKSFVVIGLRHLDAGGPRFFHGSVEDARVYTGALDAKTIASLRPDRAGGPEPLGWWTFQEGKAVDVTGHFPPARLAGGARIEGGRLLLDGDGDFIVAGRLEASDLAPARLAGTRRGTSSARGKALFADRFAGRLAPGWSWIREHKGFWRLGERSLEIRVEPGLARSVRNALVRKAPDRRAGPYAVEVTVSNLTPPTRQYEQLGITWYRGDRPVFKLVKEHIDGDLWIIPGKKHLGNRRVTLRLLVDGERWKAQYRPDGETKFATAAEGKLPPPSAGDRISLQCYNGPPDAEHWMRFEDFRIARP